MSIIRNIRESIDTRLDHLDARAEALEAQLEGTRDEALKRVEQQKENLVTALSRMEQKVSGSVAKKSADLHAAFDHLRVQLTLGKAETTDLLKEQEIKIRDAVQTVEERLEHAEEGLEDNLAKQASAFVGIANKLRAEFEAAELQFALFQGEHREDVEAGKDALRGALNNLRDKLKNAGHEVGERLGDFENEFGAGLAHIRKAFLELGKRD